MAIFSNKIIEASFTNKDQNQIEILYKEDDKIYPYHIQVNHNHPDFQDLIKEYSLEKIQEITRQKIESRIREVERANIKDLDRIKTEIFYIRQCSIMFLQGVLCQRLKYSDPF